MVKQIRALAVAIALIGVPTLGAAQDRPAEDEHRGPRPESIAACEDKSDGDACEFDAPRGHIVGTCHKARTGDLACMHHHHHPDGGAS
jgi:hypothetical protein